MKCDGDLRAKLLLAVAVPNEQWWSVLNWPRSSWGGCCQFSQRFAVRLTLNKIHNTWRGFCDCECAITKHAILRELYPQMCLGINFNKRVRDIYSILYRILYCVLCSILYLNTILHTIHHTKLHTVLCSILYYILYCTIHYVLYCILYCTLSCSRLHGST